MAKSKKITLSKKVLDTAYKKKMRDIKRYVTFKYTGKLTAAQKREITIYHKRIFGPGGFASQPTHFYATKNKERLKAAKYWAGDDSGLKKIKGAFIPIESEGIKPRITFSKTGAVTVKYKHVTRRFIPLSAKELLTPGAVDKKLSHEIAEEFTIKVGQHDTKARISKDMVEHYIGRMMDQYKDADKFIRGVTSLRGNKRQRDAAYNRHVDARQAHKKKRRKERERLYKKEIREKEKKLTAANPVTEAEKLAMEIELHEAQIAKAKARLRAIEIEKTKGRKTGRKPRTGK